LYGNAGSANASSTATGVRGVASYTVQTSASSPAFSNTATTTGAYAIADSAVGWNNFGISVNGSASGQADSQATIIPTNSTNNTNSALLTQADIGQTNLGSLKGNFTVLGQGYIGAIASSSATAETYNMSAEYKISSAVIGNGSEDLLIGNTYQYGSPREYSTGSGISNINLIIIDNGKTLINDSFSNYTDFVTFINTTSNLTHVTGSQDIVVSLSETVASSNGAGWYYSLALVSDGSSTGSFRPEIAVVATPLPASWLLMVSALPLLWGSKNRKQA
jgi:hypothetical protein